MLQKRSQQSGLLSESPYSAPPPPPPPKGLSFTDLRTQLKSRARHTLSNQKAQVKALDLLL